MNRLLRNVFALVLMFVSSTAFAAQTTAQARAVLRSCGYYSTQEVEVGLSYQNTTLPWGTSVELHYGWGGYESSPTNPFDWRDSTSVAVPATAPYTWGVTVTKQIAARSSPVFFEHIDFVWKVSLPDGSVFYEKGNNSTWGYYKADFSQVARPCTSTAGFIGTPTSLAVTSVVKW